METTTLHTVILKDFYTFKKNN